MKIHIKLNPLLEVMHYYNRRVNGSSVSDTMFQMEHAYADRKDKLHPLFSRIIQIEALLNSELTPDADRLDFFFKRLDGVSYDDGTDRLPASLLLLDAFYRNIDQPEQIQSYLDQKSTAYIRSEICGALSDDETHKPVISSLESLVEFVDSLPFPDNTKWRVMDLCKHFHDYTHELVSLLRPAVELIERNSGMFDELITCYSGALGNDPEIPVYIRSLIGLDISEYASIEIHPSVLGFNSVTLVMPDSHTEPLRIYMGVLMHLVGAEKVSVDIAEIARSMKALGDPSRLEMLCSICHRPTYGQELSSRFGVSSTTVYHHMNKLIVAGLVESKLNGNRVYFSMKQQNALNLIEQLRALLLESK